MVFSRLLHDTCGTRLARQPGRFAPVLAVAWVDPGLAGGHPRIRTLPVLRLAVPAYRRFGSTYFGACVVQPAICHVSCRLSGRNLRKIPVKFVVITTEAILIRQPPETVATFVDAQYESELRKNIYPLFLPLSLHVSILCI